MNDEEKLVILATHGPEDPERATLPFVMGCAALASDVQAVIGFQGHACELVRKGGVDRVAVPEYPPLADLLVDFTELGGKLLLCSPCMMSQAMTEEDLVDGAEVVAAGRFVAEVTSSTNTLTY